MALAVEYEPALVEAATLIAIRSHAQERAFRQQRDPLYEVADHEARDRAFAALHGRWFEELGLAEPLETAMGELDALRDACGGRCVVGGARDDADEAADLFMPAAARPLVPAGIAPATPDVSAPPPGVVVVVRLRPDSLAVPTRALTLLRHELLHVADMLDPAFGYAPRLPADESGAPFRVLLAARYRALWDAHVDGRLARAGRGVPGAHAERYRQFRRAFPELGDGVDAQFERFWNGARCTHAEMVACASGPRAPRCQLCRLPSPSVNRAGPPAPALAAIAEDFPAWDPGAPICERCAEVYTMVPLQRGGSAPQG
jgi:hypothetical protein